MKFTLYLVNSAVKVTTVHTGIVDYNFLNVIEG